VNGTTCDIPTDLYSQETKRPPALDVITSSPLTSQQLLPSTIVTSQVLPLPSPVIEGDQQILEQEVLESVNEDLAEHKIVDWGSQQPPAASEEKDGVSINQEEGATLQVSGAKITERGGATNIEADSGKTQKTIVADKKPDAQSKDDSD
jgi:hypothetical protein